jgi:hypothetical protein
MADLLKIAIEAVRRLSEAEQDAIVRQTLVYAQANETVEAMDPVHETAAVEALAQVERGEFATDRPVEAAVRSFG